MSWNIGLQDKIGTVSHSVGVISLQSSLLTLGGRQYQTGILSRTISADVTLTANTLYFVYTQVISGVAALRVSASAPSIYRVANPTAKIVGAFVTGWQSSFGQFLQIDTRYPNFSFNYSRATYTPPSNAAIIIPSWATDGLYFDNTNGYLRIPLAGAWEFIVHHFHQGNPGAIPANSVSSNYQLGLHSKATVPSLYSDTTDGFSTNNPILGGGITYYDTIKKSAFNMVAGHYAWLWVQSNDYTRGMGIATIEANLKRIATAIQDM